MEKNSAFYSRCTESILKFVTNTPVELEKFSTFYGCYFRPDKINKYGAILCIKEKWTKYQVTTGVILLKPGPCVGAGAY